MRSNALPVLVGILVGASAMFVVDSLRRSATGTLPMPESDRLPASAPAGTRSLDARLAELTQAAGLGAGGFEQIMREALQSNGAERARTTRVAASVWALADPASAVEYLAGLSSRRDRVGLTAIALGAWAIQEPDAALFELDRLYRAGIGLDGFERHVVELVANQAPLIVLDNVSDLSEEIAQLGIDTAIEALARTDPGSALSYLALAGPATEREARTLAIMRGWARLDPDAALDWVQRQSDVPAFGYESTVIREVAAIDPFEAFELALARVRNAASLRQSLEAVMTAALGSGIEGQASKLADNALRATASQQMPAALLPLLQTWLRSEPRVTLQWLARQAGEIPDGIFEALARQIQIDRSNAELAASYTDNIPDSARRGWIEGVGQAYALQNPAAAADWTERFRNGPHFAAAVLAVARGLVTTDPARAVALLDRARLPAADERVMLQQAASRWAEWDPDGLRQWAASVNDRSRLSAVAGNVADALARTDPAGAQQWALQLPAGTDRDQALGAALIGSVSSSVSAGHSVTQIDEQVLAAFSSDFMRQQVLVTIAAMLARQDADAARAFSDAYVTDAGMRERVEQTIAGGRP